MDILLQKINNVTNSISKPFYAAKCLEDDRNRYDIESAKP